MVVQFFLVFEMASSTPFIWFWLPAFLAATNFVFNSHSFLSQPFKGVEDAIAKTKKNCTTKTVTTDLDKKVKEKQQKVKEKTDDLNKAIKDQESKEKIAKKRKKLDEAKADLNKALAEQKTK